VFEVDPPLLIEDSYLEHTQTKKAEDDDEHAADPLQPDLVVVKGTAECGSAGAEQDEHEGEPRHEEQGVKQRSATPTADFGQGHPGDEPYI
jgi:hypothetical protein